MQISKEHKYVFSSWKHFWNYENHCYIRMHCDFVLALKIVPSADLIITNWPSDLLIVHSVLVGAFLPCQQNCLAIIPLFFSFLLGGGGVNFDVLITRDLRENLKHHAAFVGFDWPSGNNSKSPVDASYRFYFCPPQPPPPFFFCC